MKIRHGVKVLVPAEDGEAMLAGERRDPHVVRGNGLPGPSQVRAERGVGDGRLVRDVEDGVSVHERRQSVRVEDHLRSSGSITSNASCTRFSTRRVSARNARSLPNPVIHAGSEPP
jgi:hypothetical protein